MHQHALPPRACAPSAATSPCSTRLRSVRRWSTRLRPVRTWSARLGAVAALAVAALALPAPAMAATPASGADLCAHVGARAGFTGTRLVTAVAVALAESGCRPGVYGRNRATSGCPNGSIDRGLWQINSCYHPEVSRACAYDAQCNANAAYGISSRGTRFTPWTTYNTGAYRSYLAAAQAAVNRLG